MICPKRESTSALETLTRTVSDIRNAAMTATGRKIEVRGSGTSILELRDLSELQQQPWNALPENLEQR